MYYQINPTELFHERQLVLLEEAEDRRLARRVRSGRDPKARSRVAAVPGFLAVLVVAATILLVGLSSSAHASTTFTVNSTGDESDMSSDGVCDVSTSSGNQCTLRAALQEASFNQNAPTVDVINFNFPGSGVRTIKPGGALGIGDPVIIDGYSQPGSRPNNLEQGDNAIINIELDGSLAGEGSDGLRINRGSGTVIKGLAINNYRNYGIAVLSSAGNKIEGNFLGTDPSGTTAKPNTNGGVFIGVGGFGESKASDNTVGGDRPEHRNVLSGNFGSGVVLQEDSNKVQGNFIGTDKNGTSGLGNGFSGVAIFGASNNTIGGTTPASANIIAFNTVVGVTVLDNGIGNRVLSNSIFSNTGMGIDLGGDGVTPNDTGDADPLPGDLGANALQNFPVITSAKTSRRGTNVAGKLNSIPNKSFTVQFFVSPEVASSATAQGRILIGGKGVSTDGSGNVAFTFKPTQRIPVGQFMTATVTDQSGNTSEFSAAKKVMRKR